MKTFEEQRAYFDSQWPGMQQAARDGGAEAVLAFIDGREGDLERRVLHLFARQGLLMQDWEGKSLDVAAAVARGSIDRLVEEARIALAGGDEETSRRRTELANVISYNLAADLADCWPGERPALTDAHFEEGLRAAEDCIRWRDELMKGPGASSMAWWAKGMHLLSLGRVEEAVRGFHQSLSMAREIAQSDEDFGIVLGRGYTGLARWINGEDVGRVEYREALAVFAAQLMDEEHKDDARFGIDQLETVKLRYGPAVPA